MSDGLWARVPTPVQHAKRRIGHHVRPYQERFAARLLDRKIATVEPLSVEQLGGAVPGQRSYVPSGWFFLRRGLQGYRVGPGDVFVDFGSGKGRLVYQAARLPFARVVGIELHEELTQVAHANIERNRSRLSCRNIELITGDVTTTPVPDDMTIAYMFNPVTGKLFRQLMDNIVASLQGRPRRLRLIYANPVEAEEVERSGHFQLIRGSRGLRQDLAPYIHIYESLGPS